MKKFWLIIFFVFGPLIAVLNIVEGFVQMEGWQLWLHTFVGIMYLAMILWPGWLLIKKSN